MRAIHPSIAISSPPSLASVSSVPFPSSAPSGRNKRGMRFASLSAARRQRRRRRRRFRPQIWAIRLHFQALLFVPPLPPPLLPLLRAAAGGAHKKIKSCAVSFGRKMKFTQPGRKSARSPAVYSLARARDGSPKNSITACDAMRRRRRQRKPLESFATCERRESQMTDGGERERGRDGDDDGNSGNHRLTSRDEGKTRGKGKETELRRRPI